MGTFSLYVHIPYCQAKCPYCDFNSYAATQWPEKRYADALIAELKHYVSTEPWAGSEIGTIFFGGGTPSLFAPGSIASVLNAVARLWSVAGDVEVTLEANPGAISLEKLAGFHAAGVNRMSFGVQSFWPHHLQRLGRIHGPEEALAVLPLARRAGFDNVSLDLIFALPEQTVGEWEADLERACAQQPDHVSAYNLTYEEGTPFHQWKARGMLRQLPEEIEVAMFTGAQETLSAAGYEQYEISNYARPGRACRHNLNYWQSGAYLGVGAGAHSYSGPTRDIPAAWGDRWSNEKSPTTYMQAIERDGHARASMEKLDEHQARGEFVFLGLRCRSGFSARRFRDRFGQEVPAVFPHVPQLQEDGLVEYSADHWRLTARGLLLADSVFATFL